MSKKQIQREFVDARNPTEIQRKWFYLDTLNIGEMINMKHAKKNDTFTCATITLFLFHSECRNNQTLEKGKQIRHVFVKHGRVHLNVAVLKWQGSFKIKTL
jgi:hypothetical protein